MRKKYIVPGIEFSAIECDEDIAYGIGFGSGRKDVGGGIEVDSYDFDFEEDEDEDDGPQYHMDSNCLDY